MKRRKNIGFLSFWGINKGLPKMTLNYVKMLLEDHDVFVLKQGTNDISDSFKQVSDLVSITEYPEYHVDPDFFKKWVLENKLDFVLFNEYNQWTVQEENLVDLARELGVRVYGNLVLERFDDSLPSYYEKILAPTRSYMTLMRRLRVRNATYIPFSLDLSLYTPKYLEVKDDEPFKFIHVAGTGGVHNRKNTSVVIEAFKQLDDKNTILTIVSQVDIPVEEHPRITYVKRDLPEKELFELIADHHACLNPSKWQTIGIPIVEAMALGTPVITNDIPPMNEFVKPGVSGYLCRVHSSTYDGISIEAAEVEPSELKVRMKSIMQPVLYNILARNSRAVVEQEYNLDLNKHDFLLLFED
jgi:glycosyltransferase involved in cell wall biosynthesis